MSHRSRLELLIGQRCGEHLGELSLCWTFCESQLKEGLEFFCSEKLTLTEFDTILAQVSSLYGQQTFPWGRFDATTTFVIVNSALS
jgi:hypothetical protein